MTSINAMRFNRFQGIMICDEQRSWNPDRMKIWSAYKIKPIIPEEVQREQGLAAGYGNTGTSTIGDELRTSISKHVATRYTKAKEEARGIPADFMTIRELASLVYEIIVNTKHRHIDQELKGKYGFDTKDFIAGFYKKNGQKVELKDKDIIRQADELITWKGRNEAARAVFGNAGIVAGYEPREGFRIFLMSQAEQFCEAVQAAFIAQGSGLDATNFVFSDFLSVRALPERREDVDPDEGLLAALTAVNAASRYNVGVGGYYNILVFDGREKDNMAILREINDHRSKLASEIALACSGGFIREREAARLVGAIILRNQSLQEVVQEFSKYVRDKRALTRFLRGYKRDKWMPPATPSLGVPLLSTSQWQSIM